MVWREEYIECAALLALAGPVTALSSETFVLTGTTVLWLKKEGEDYWLTSTGRCGNRPDDNARLFLPPGQQPAAPSLAYPRTAEAAPSGMSR